MKTILLHIVFCSLACYGAASPLPQDMHAWAVAVIDCIYKENFRVAEEEARKIIRSYPSHPAGYFFMAAAIDSWMAAYLTDRRESEFYRFCELAIEKAERILDKEDNNEWAAFFMGGAEGYKGTYEARYERWITAFRYGWKGVSILTKLHERKSTLVDIQYGIGSYEYWRSALMKSLRWMPGVDDKRASGIQKIDFARKNGVYTKMAASIGLIDIYFNEKQYDSIIQIADAALKRYPVSRIFLFSKARALLELNKPQEAAFIFRSVQRRAEKNPVDEHANIALCHFWIAKAAFASGRYEECIAECNLMKSYKFNDDTKKLLDNYFSEVQSLKKKAREEKKKKKNK